MSILESLRQVESEIFDDLHPLAKEPIALREAYAIGYAMLVCVSGYPSEIVKKQLKREIVALGLPSKYRKTAITIAMEADPNVVHHLLAMLVEPSHKYIFMLDLYDYAFQDQKVNEQEQEFLLLFERLLNLSAHELQFVRGFRLAMLKKDAEIASKVVQEAMTYSLPVPLQELHYFLKSFEYWKHEAPKQTDKAPVYHTRLD